MKRVGIIIPIYNTEKYLRQCIDSVINQTYKNIEIILVDDGSTDSSGKICDEYASKDNRIKVIHQENQGMIASRYNGAKIAESDYLTFVDSDDWIDLNCYENFIEQMEQNIDVIAFQHIAYFNENYKVARKDDFRSGLYNGENYKKEIYSRFLWDFNTNKAGISPSVWNKLIKKDLLLKSLELALSIKNISYGEDIAIMSFVIKNAKSLYLSEKYLYYYRQRLIKSEASYFKDNQIYYKIYLLYDYLIKLFADDELAIDQINARYTGLINNQNQIQNYKNKYKFTQYIFPFNLIKTNTNIIIYGAGNVGKSYFNQLQTIQYAKKIEWVDTNYKKYNDPKIKNPEIIKDKTDYDYVVIAIEDEKIANHIKEYLISLGASETKIIYQIYKLFI